MVISHAFLFTGSNCTVQYRQLARNHEYSYMKILVFILFAKAMSRLARSPFFTNHNNEPSLPWGKER